MTQNGRLLSGRCDMQLVGLKDTYFPVNYELLLATDEVDRKRAVVEKVQRIECSEVTGMPAGTYILADMPNVMLSNFSGTWTLSATA